MPSFQFKIKGYLNETGEFTEFFPAESGTIIQLILQHWFNESLPNNLDIVVIQNERGERLVIDHIKRDIFDYYFVQGNRTRNYFHKKTDIQFMFFALESFFNNRTEDIKLNLTKTSDDWTFITGDYLGKNFNYSITRQALWKNLNVLILQLLFLLALIVSSILFSRLLLVFAAFYLVIAIFTSIRQVRLFRQYYFDNKNLEVKLSRADGELKISNGAGTRSIPKSDINKVTKYVHPPDDAASMNEYYTEVEFINGNVLNLTCLLIPQAQIEAKFANDNVLVDVEFTSNGRLKRKTRLDQYFSAVRPVDIARISRR
jgi:hypothetical protein